MTGKPQKNRYEGSSCVTIFAKRHGVTATTVAAIALVTCEAFFWIAMIVSRGEFWRGAVFTYTGHHFGNDAYIPLAAAQAYDPWASGLNYPAGALLLFKCLTLMTPTQMRQPVGSSFYQTYYSSAAAMIFLYTISLVVLCVGVAMLLRTRQTAVTRWLVTIGILLSSPLIFNYISQNCVVLVAGLTTIFAALYDSDFKWKRYVGYILLGIAASIKLYPAAFAWLILFGKYRKEFIVCCAISAGCILLPFFCYDGLQSIGEFLANLSNESAEKVDWGVGYNYSLQNFVKTMSILVGAYYAGPLSIIFKLIIVTIVVLVSAMVRKDWERWFLVATSFIWFFDYSYQYMLAFYIPSFIMMLQDDDLSSQSRALFAVAFLLILIPYATPCIQLVNEFYDRSGFLTLRGEDGGTIYPMSYGCLLANIVIVGLTVVLTVRGFLRGIKTRCFHERRDAA